LHLPDVGAAPLGIAASGGWRVLWAAGDQTDGVRALLSLGVESERTVGLCLFGARATLYFREAGARIAVGGDGSRAALGDHGGGSRARQSAIAARRAGCLAASGGLNGRQACLRREGANDLTWSDVAVDFGGIHLLGLNGGLCTHHQN